MTHKALTALALLLPLLAACNDLPNNLPTGRKVANDPDSTPGGIFSVVAYSVPGGCVYAQYKTGMTFAPAPCMREPK